MAPRGASQACNTPAERTLRLGLGALWVLDGLLLFLPHQGMNTLYMVAMGGWGQPAWLINLVDAVVNLVYRHGWAQAFAWSLGGLQVAVGGLVFLGPRRPWGRAGLWASVGLGAGIWVLGEWMGGLWTLGSGGASFLSGGPGPVVPYVLGAALVLTAHKTSQEVFLSRLRAFLGGLWLLGAALEAIPAMWTPALGEVFREALVLTQQGPWTVPMGWMAQVAARHPVPVNAVLTSAMLLWGWGILRRWRSPLFHVFASLWLAWVWWFGENFGALATGATTDPNSAPAWAVLWLALAVSRLQGDEPLAPQRSLAA